MNTNKKSIITFLICSVVLTGSIVLSIFNKKHENTAKKKYTENTIVAYNKSSKTIMQSENFFSDGLPSPDSVVTYPLDEFESGIVEKAIFEIDINKDGKLDKITREFYETGNAHAFYKYKIELNNNGSFLDITPNNFQTINGGECDLKLIQFNFDHKFTVTVIYRELEDTWNNPTTAYKQVYNLSNKNLVSTKIDTLKSVCDVKELF